MRYIEKTPNSPYGIFMGIVFTQIIDDRLNSGSKTELKQVLKDRLAQIETNLKQLGGLEFSFGEFRFLNWEAKGREPESFQWRVDCALIKPKKVLWDEVYTAINIVYPVHYEKRPDLEIKQIMKEYASLAP